MGKKEIFLIIGVAALALIVGGVIGRMKDTSGKEDVTITAEQQSPVNQPPFDYAAYIQKILKERPDDAKTFAEAGDIYFDQHRFIDAIEYYKKAIAIDPQDVDSYNDMGLSYHYIGKSDEGLKYVEDGIKKNPVYQRAWLTKGFILAIKGNIPEARVSLEKAYSIDPNSDVGRSAASFLEQYKGIANK